MTTKAELRAQMRVVRAAIAAEGRARSAAICARLVALDQVRRARVVMAFVGVRGEPALDDAIAAWHRDGVAVALPRLEGDAIAPVLHAPGAELSISPLGIPEPVGDSVDLRGVDVIIVPGMAFTADGRRLGRGGGHYDRVLATLSPETTTIGVCFAEQIVEDLPIEEHDRPVEVVVSDAGVHVAGGRQTSSS